MFVKVKVADLIAALAGLLLFVSSLLHQFGGSYNAYHELVINVLVVTYLLGVVVAATSIACSLGVLPERWPWRAWTSAVAAVVLLNAVFGAVALSQIIKDLSVLAGRPDVGLGAGVYLGIAATVVLFAVVTLRPVVGFLERPVVSSPARKAAVAEAVAEPAPTGTDPVAPAGSWASDAGPSPAGSPWSAGQVQVPARFAPFWAAVPTPRPIYRAGDPDTVLAILHPGIWYAAVAPHLHGLIVQLPTGETGVLVEVNDLFHG
jgi:hypothetical protein